MFFFSQGLTVLEGLGLEGVECKPTKNDMFAELFRIESCDLNPKLESEEPNVGAFVIRVGIWGLLS